MRPHNIKALSASARILRVSLSMPLLAGCYLGGRWLTTRPKALAEIERLVKVGPTGGKLRQNPLTRVSRF